MTIRIYDLMRYILYRYLSKCRSKKPKPYPNIQGGTCIVLAAILAVISMSFILDLPVKYIKVSAPFGMTTISVPDFSNTKKFSIVDFGAVKGDKEKISNAISRAINEANAAGGATVVVPAGEWLTKKIHFKKQCQPAFR